MINLQIAACGSRWLSGDWNKDDILVCCEAKLSRNLEFNPFSTNASVDDRNRIRGLFQQAYAGMGEREMLDASVFDDTMRQVIIENRMASADFSSNQPFTCIFYNPANGNSACVNDRDHVRIRSVGSTLWEAVEKAQGEEQELIDSGMSFAYRREFGFLTSHYEESGSGMRISAILHLPATNLLSMALPLSLKAAVSRVAVSRAFGPSGGNGYFCNMVQVHVDPPSVAHINGCVKSLASIIDLAVEKERSCREILKADCADMEQAHNDIGISWGILTNMKSVDFDMAGKAISHAVLAVKCGLYDGAGRKKIVNALRDAVIQVMPGHLDEATGVFDLAIPAGRRRAALLRGVLRKNTGFGLK